MAAEYAEDKKLIRFNHSFENDIIVTSRNMAKRYKCYMPHIQNVEEAALKVFDSLKKYHGLGARERLLLQIAANLHSCGKFVTMRGSEECGYNMIMATEIIGLSHVEREIVANIVKYHQQKFRYNEVEVSAKPSKDSRLASTEDLSIVIAKLTGHSAAGQFHGPGPYRKIKRQPPECEGRTAGNPDGLRGRCDAGVHIHCG